MYDLTDGGKLRPPASNVEAPSQVDDNEDYEDTVQHCSEWLCSMIVPDTQTKVTLFDVRAFFELGLWATSHASGTDRSAQVPELSIKKLFEIACNTSLLMRRCKKLAIGQFERLLFDRFHISCVWIPSDLTMTLVHLLYDVHCLDVNRRNGSVNGSGQGGKSRGSSKKPLTTSEVKRADKERELCKMATNWLVWMLAEGQRHEVRILLKFVRSMDSFFSVL